MTAPAKPAPTDLLPLIQDFERAYLRLRQALAADPALAALLMAHWRLGGSEAAAGMIDDATSPWMPTRTLEVQA